MELDGRRELFCREYLKDLNASAAYLRAGYQSENPDKNAYGLMRSEAVVERISELAAVRNRQLELDANDIIVELLRMLTSDPLNYVDEAGRVKRLADIPLDARRAIASFEVETTGTQNTVTRTKVKFWSKEKAAELLGRHLTLFKDVLTVEGLDDLATRIYAARERDIRVIEHEPSAEDLV